MKTTRSLTLLALLMVFAVNCTKPDEPNNGGNNNGNNSVVDNSGTLNGHNYVDLGLPSGTLWATCNVGANSPEGYGDYYSWGEIIAKLDYSWDSYIYSYDSMYSHLLNKYCTYEEYGHNGLVDNLIVLQPGDDAATANWGSGWCTPTKDNWDELYHYTTNYWIKRENVFGRLFSGANGNTIFLPAAGDISNEEYIEVGSNGYYWSSSLCTARPQSAWGFYFDANYYDNYYGSRFLGRSVRPIRSTN